MAEPRAHTKVLTARFYRIEAEDSEGPVSLSAMPFEEILHKYADRTYEERRFETRDAVFLFEPRNVERSALAMHKLRSEGEYLSRIDAKTGQVKEIMATDEEGTYADTSCVVFVDSVNVFGIVRGNSGAPTASRVSDWLNAVKPLKRKDLRFHAKALITEPDLKKILYADGAKKFEIDLPVEFLDKMGVSLALDTRAAAEVAPGATVKLSLSYGHSRPDGESSRGMLAVVKDLMERGGLDKASRAEVTLVREVEAARKGKTKLEMDMVDLLESQLAKSFQVLLSGTGVSINGTILGLMNTVQNSRSEIVRTWERNETESS